MKITGCYVLTTIAWAMLSINSWAANTKDNAVILLYHHVSEATPASTSVSPEMFEKHMQFLADNHNVLPLQSVIDALRNKKPLPDKAVVITFDDGYKNIYQNAHPIMQKFGFPYHVFINPPLIGRAKHQLTWEQVHEMTTQKVTFSNHGKTHSHLLAKFEGENQNQWLKRVTSDIEYAEKVLKKRLGTSFKYFAYPYGEFDSVLKKRLIELGYVGFAQHSGAIASFSDFGALPRFPAAGVYANLNTLKVKINSLAMPVTDISYSDPKINLSAPLERIKFSVNTKDLNPQQINCFQSGQLLAKNVLENTVEVDIYPIEQAGRHRVNCTAPSIKNKGRFYWLSLPFFMAKPDGTWVD